MTCSAVLKRSWKEERELTVDATEDSAARRETKDLAGKYTGVRLQMTRVAASPDYATQ